MYNFLLLFYKTNTGINVDVCIWFAVGTSLNNQVQIQHQLLDVDWL